MTRNKKERKVRNRKVPLTLPEKVIIRNFPIIGL